MTWQIETAQKKLADLVELANAEGPQVLSRKGRKVAVLLAYSQFNGSTRRAGSLKEFYERCPFKGLELRVRQRRDRVRRVRL
jgi:prevent-host-death family protein